MSKFAEVILPLPLQGYFTYSIPDEWDELVEPGMRVVVSFGSKKFYAGIVARVVPEAADSQMQIKEITELLDTEPVITMQQLEFWKWIATYYMCSIGETMNAAIPSGLKMESNTVYVIHPDFNDDFSNLNDDEYMIAEAALRAEQLTPTDIQSITGRQGIHKLIKSLIEKRVIYPVEELEERYTPKKQKFISLSAEYENGGVLNALMVKLESKSPVQYKALMAYFNLSMGKRDVSLSVLNKEGGTASVAALVKKNILLVEERTVSRLDRTKATANTNSFDLSPAQQIALEEIQNSTEPQKPTLLFGVTGSGKTEIYIRLIQQTLSQGKHVLYLLPEIGLTDFIVARLRIFFGTSLLVYHSRFNAQEKVEIWNSLLESDTPKLVIGARSAIFLPFGKPGLIIVDEEHDPSYKQQDPAPRYHARDAAVMLAYMTGARILLGSGTPSLESWHKAINGNYHLVKLTERYGNAKFPDVSIVDIRKATFTKKMLGPLSPELYEATKTAVSQKRQVILFQNRRGYSTWIECEQCGWTPTCRNCDVSMTYHKNIDLLKCHYCGYTDKTPQKCPSCGSSQVMMRGMGTQRVEDDLGIIFKDNMIARMDMDTTRGKKALSELFKGFDDGRFSILVGTQMITKGLDFSRVDVVGILNGDNMHTFPNFRAHEHAFQTMMQVAGRAGRRDNTGRVFIQVYDKNNPIVRFVSEENYQGFMELELKSRKQYLYPPFVRLIRFSVLHKDKLVAMKASGSLAAALRKVVGDKQLLGPEFPPVPRVKNYYIRHILVKLPRNNELQMYKSRITSEITVLLAHPDYKGIRIIADVDPV